MRDAAFAFIYQGNGATPCQYIDTTRKATDCATTLCWQFLYNETLQQTSRPLLSKLVWKTTNLGIWSPILRKLGAAQNLGWWLVGKPVYDFLFILNFFRYLLPLRRYKSKCVKTRCYQKGVGQFEPRFQGEEVIPGEYCLLSIKLDTFCIWQCKLHRAMCSRF